MLAERYNKLLYQIQGISAYYGRSRPQLCVVSKTADSYSMKTLYEAGCRDFAENRLESFLEKKVYFDNLGLNDIRWHFIGHLQSRKVPKLIPHVSLFHSVHSIESAECINKHACSYGKIAQVLLQVNVTGEKSKQGLDIAGWHSCFEQVKLLNHVSIRGVMTMAPLDAAQEDLNRAFSSLKSFQEQLSLQIPTCQELSMGMSKDYQAAIACGSTLLRIGSILFS